MPIDCVTNPVTRCVDCPEIDGVPAVPAHIESQNAVGWNAGANSVRVVVADLFTRFQLDGLVGGIAIGLRGSLDRNWIPELIESGYYFTTLANRYFVSVVELGVIKVENIEVSFSSVYEIRRVAGRARYFVDNDLVYTSLVQRLGPRVVNCCLYSTGDSIA
jgi:hypothetical protein